MSSQHCSFTTDCFQNVQFVRSRTSELYAIPQRLQTALRASECASARRSGATRGRPNRHFSPTGASHHQTTGTPAIRTAPT